MNPSVFFHADYAPQDQPHFARLRHVADALRALGADERIPPLLDARALAGLHDAPYIEAILRGVPPLASSAHLPWTPSLRQACLRMLGGQIAAAKAARESGCSFNLAIGFHHALPSRGGGFCVFNGLALVAHHFPKWQVAVLDCDEHGGDGTETFCARLENLRQVSVFGTRFGIRGGVRSRAFPVPRGDDADTDRAYLEAVDQALDALLADPVDLLLYQAGMDCHRDDPKSTLRLSTETVLERDRRVFAAARQHDVPVLVVLGGAYQRWDAVARLYCGTWNAAISAGSARGSL